MNFKNLNKFMEFLLKKEFEEKEKHKHSNGPPFGPRPRPASSVRWWFQSDRPMPTGARRGVNRAVTAHCRHMVARPLPVAMSTRSDETAGMSTTRAWYNHGARFWGVVAQRAARRWRGWRRRRWAEASQLWRSSVDSGFSATPGQREERLDMV
jgi:hypothetical protein